MRRPEQLPGYVRSPHGPGDAQWKRLVSDGTGEPVTGALGRTAICGKAGDVNAMLRMVNMEKEVSCPRVQASPVTARSGRRSTAADPKGTGLTAEKPEACQSSAACTEFPKELQRAGVNLPASARGESVKVSRAGDPDGSRRAGDT